jgi:hydrogenase/urease accessory protein HupE
MIAMTRAMRRFVLALALMLPAFAAVGHEMSMAEMDVRETADGRFLWQWAATNEKLPDGAALTPEWPAACRADGGVLQCGAGGLRGRMSVSGVGKSYSAALVRVTWLDGQSRVFTLTAAHSSVQLYGSADDRRGLGEIATTYGALGVEHILTGYDHLLFVAGLLFLVGFRRRLFWTITAFTAAHSLTLACAALGWLTLRSPPVEASIALSIVLVAHEALNERDTLARRWPAALAFLFGLVHGLGFAGALQELGLPQRHLAIALLSFNAGVEVGQLLAIAAAWAFWRLLRDRLAPLRTPALYAVGSLAAYWTWLRVAAIAG